MREIKFRAWINSPDIRLVVSNKESAFMTYEIDNIDYLHKDLYFGGGFCVKLGEVVLMQFTGLKDENEYDIYEGDILKTGKGIIGWVIWEDNRSASSFKYKNAWHTNYKGKYIWKSLAWAAKRSKVIGNIYENPDILNEKT